MNNFRVLAFFAFFAVLSPFVTAESNSTPPAQQAVKDQPQKITTSPEPAIQQQPQPNSQNTTTEQIIDRTHQYYDRALNKALIVIVTSFSILTGVFVAVAFFLEWQRNRSFKQQLDKKEQQLQEYFDERIKEETDKLKKDAQKQLDEVIQEVKRDLGLVYLSLGTVFEEFHIRYKDYDFTDLVAYSLLSAVITDIDTQGYEFAASNLNFARMVLHRTTDKSELELIHKVSDRVAQKVTGTDDDGLKKTWEKFHEAYILKKNELGYEEPDEDETNKEKKNSESDE